MKIKKWTKNRILWEYYGYLRKENPEKAKKFKKHLWKSTYPNGDNSNWITVLSVEDGYSKKRFFPFHFTIDDMYKFEDEHQEILSSPWDCTGQRFTSGFDFCKTTSGTWVYIHYRYDV